MDKKKKLGEKSPSLMNNCMCGNCKNCWNHLAKLERNKTLADVEKKAEERKYSPKGNCSYGSCISINQLKQILEEIKNLEVKHD